MLVAGALDLGCLGFGIALAAGVEQSTPVIYYAAADATNLLEVAAILIEGSLEVGAAGCSGSVAARVVLMGVIQGLCNCVSSRRVKTEMGRWTHSRGWGHPRRPWHS